MSTFSDIKGHINTGQSFCLRLLGPVFGKSP